MGNEPHHPTPPGSTRRGGRTNLKALRTPQDAPLPRPRPAPKPGPAPDTEPLYGAERPIPPMIDGVRTRVRDVDHLEAITDCYHDPRTVAPQDDEYVRHWTTDVELVIGRADGVIVYVRDHDVDAGRPTWMPDDTKPRPRKRRTGGGHAGHLPRTTRDFLDRLAEEGCVVSRAGSQHYRVIGPDGGARITVGCTPSDSRSLPNDIANAQRVLGVNVRRGGKAS